MAKETDDSVRMERTYDEARAASAAELTANPSRGEGDATMPFNRWAALHRIEKLRPVIQEAGDGFAMLRAVRECAFHRVRMPEWLAEEFIRRFDLVDSFSVGRWDDAFGRPYPKGTHLKSSRERRRWRYAVYVTAKKLQLRGTGISADLFEQVADTLGLKKTFVETLYYEQKRAIVRPRK